MMIVMSTEATPEQIHAVVARIEANGFNAHLSQGEERTVIGVVGNSPIKAREQFLHLPGGADLLDERLVEDGPQGEHQEHHRQRPREEVRGAKQKAKSLVPQPHNA